MISRRKPKPVYVITPYGRQTMQSYIKELERALRQPNAARKIMDDVKRLAIPPSVLYGVSDANQT